MSNNSDLFSQSPIIQEYTVSEISTLVRNRLEQGLERVRVRGEISNLSKQSSGHLYFDLKDSVAVLNVACWRPVAARITFSVTDGTQVVVTGRMTTYPGRSRYQLIVDNMDLAGQGALLLELLERKKKLEVEGLFSQERKKKLPFLPRTVGLITSPTGAVIQDILHRLQERFPVRLLLWPVAVQGNMAADQVIKAIEGFNNLPLSLGYRPDVLVIARGGGSFEDLWPFNDERLVRSVAASSIPIISAIGHETDTTLIDLAADYRAPTPTAAAEIIVPARQDLLRQLQEIYVRLNLLFQQKFDKGHILLTGLGRVFERPENLYETQLQQLDEIDERLHRAIKRFCSDKKQYVLAVADKLNYGTNQIRFVDQHYQQIGQRLRSSIETLYYHRQQQAGGISISQAAVWRFYQARNNLILVEQQLKSNWTSRQHDSQVRLATYAYQLVSPLSLVDSLFNNLKTQIHFKNYLYRQVVQKKNQEFHIAQEYVNIRQLKRIWEELDQKVDNLSSTLDGLSVTRLLKRGFLLAHDQAGGLLDDITKLVVGETIQLQFWNGTAEAIIKGKQP